MSASAAKPYRHTEPPCRLTFSRITAACRSRRSRTSQPNMIRARCVPVKWFIRHGRTAVSPGSHWLTRNPPTTSRSVLVHHYTYTRTLEAYSTSRVTWATLSGCRPMPKPGGNRHVFRLRPQYGAIPCRCAVLTDGEGFGILSGQSQSDRAGRKSVCGRYADSARVCAYTATTHAIRRSFDNV